MELFQILDCSSTLGTCCSSYGVAQIIGTTRTIFGIIQIIVPILLIVMTTIQFVKLVINPDEKGGNKKIINKFIAAAIVFFIPLLADAVLGLLPNTYNISACWEEAINSTEIGRAVGNNYIGNNSNGIAFRLNDNEEYESGNPKKKPTPGASGPNIGNAQTGDLGGGGGNTDYGSGTGTGSAKGLEIVAYAKRFIGQRYVFAGRWNGEEPYTPTDCSGFVSGVYKHFGYSLYPQTGVMWRQKEKYTLVSPGDIRAGDLIMYDGHVGILTGNGTEIVHAKGRKFGVVLDPDYRRCSSHAILGIMRINGVN